MSVNEDDGFITAGDPLPDVSSVRPLDRYRVLVSWKGGSQDEIDLASDILAFRIYEPLREDRASFETVHVSDGGSAIAWGPDDAIAMPATALKRLKASNRQDVSVD